MSNTYNNQNLLQDSVVFGNFVNCDVVSAGGAQANAKFKRNVFVGGDLTLGREKTTIVNSVTTYENSGGNIILRKNGVLYTLTPTILSYLTTITSNIQTQINNIDLSVYLTSASLTTALLSYVTNSSLTTTLLSYVTNSSLTTALLSYVTNSSLTTTLSSYVTNSSLTTSLSNYTTNTALSTTLTNYITSSSLNDNFTIGTATKILTINSQLLATNGFYSTTLVYNAYTTEYNRFFGNFIMFYNFASAPSGSQLLPVILAGKSTTITFYNNTPHTLSLRANTGSGLYGLSSPTGAQTIQLLSGYIYEFIIMYGASAYDNWFNSTINTQKRLVDAGTDITITGTKTFTTVPLYTGTYPVNDNSTKLASTAWVKGVGFLTSASLTGLANLNSPSFTGTPTAPNPSIANNSTQIATTSYVQNSLAIIYNQYGLTQYADTGGDNVFNSGIYRYHIFKNSGTITFTKSNVIVNVFLIGGGGAGGSNHGGGGGAGEITHLSLSNIMEGTDYSVTVGNGGTNTGTLAGNSSFIGGTISISVNGGGRGGGASNGIASSGGSGGGGAGYVVSTGGGASSKVFGLGTIGGNGIINVNTAGGGGGGGGSGSKGSDAPTGGSTTSSGGVGGSGTNTFSSLISFISSYMPSTWKTKTSTGVIASGGSGGSWGNPVVTAPAGGGGSGGTNSGGSGTISPIAGEDFTGGGGGGGGSGTQSGANGGSGLVVISYIYNNSIITNATNLLNISISPSSLQIRKTSDIILDPGVYMIYFNCPIFLFSGTRSFDFANASISTNALQLDKTAQQTYSSFIFPDTTLVSAANNFFYLNTQKYVDITVQTTFYGMIQIYGAGTYTNDALTTKLYATRFV